MDRLSAIRRQLAVAHPSGKLVCVACAHRCKLAEGARGVCLVRRRVEDALAVPWGYAASVAVDPIEKKPFFHFLPGSAALSFGMLGCDLHCAYCQNWLTSQSLRDERASVQSTAVTPDQLVAAAQKHRCTVITSTYNEPLITAEWAYDVFRLAKRTGLRTSFVSNGHATGEVLDFLAPVLDACKVDLKSFRRESYRALGGKLEAVLETIRALVARGIWCEVVTLVVPGWNDSDQELGAIATFLAGVSPHLPWHVTAFHPDYQMTDPPRTPASTLARAARLGEEAGLKFVYAGNLPGQLERLEDTHCPGCGATLIQRRGFVVLRNRLGEDGRCPQCGTTIAGVWQQATHLAAGAEPPPTPLASP